MILLRSSSPAPPQLTISSMVRQQPSQSPVAGFNRQLLMQGDRTAGSLIGASPSPLVRPRYGVRPPSS